MNNHENNAMRIISGILAAFMICAFLFLLIGEAVMPAENTYDKTTFDVFRGDWVHLRADGTKEPMEIPGSVSADKGEWVTIETELPATQEDTSVCVRSMQQDIKVYIDDECRAEYSTLDTQLFGNTSTLTYVFFELYDHDAGKTLRIDIMTESGYAGYVSQIYTGYRSDIVDHFYDLNSISALAAGFMLLIGLFVIISCVYVRIVYKKKIDLLQLGNVLLIASTWLLVESKLRQFIFPNSTIAMQTGFLMVAILPYPFMAYVNGVQERRYQKAYLTLGLFTAVNFVVTVTLQVLQIKDFYEIMLSSHIILIALILLIGGTVVVDVVKHRVKPYKEVAVGILVLVVGGAFEIGLVYVVDTQLNGVGLCIGLVSLLFMAGLKTIRDLVNVEKEKQKAIAASESKANFLANMSHEIRTPINTVIGMNEMILRENQDSVIDGYSRNIERASKMLLNLVNDILDFSKIEAGKLQLVTNEYRLAGMLGDVILGARVRAKQKNLELKLDIDESMPAVLRGDDFRIKQIINNLLSNAVKYTEKGSILLSAHGIKDENGFSLCVSVEDTGVGIRKENFEKLFESFERFELSKNRYIEGTGLGLNITKNLLDRMNGTIRVTSEYEKGSCFTVVIPQEVIDGTAMGKPGSNSEEAKTKKPESVFTAPNASLLIVDDSELNIAVLKGLLKRTKCKMDFASGGEEGLERTREKKYDLILMDHMMPEPDGIQTMHLIQAEADNPNRETKIIVLTANAIEGMKEFYLNEGFVDYLTKPIDINKLEEALARHLEIV